MRDTTIRLPRLPTMRSGLRKRGKIWYAIYYEDGKQKLHRTGKTNLRDASIERNKMHKMWLKLGATYKGTGNKHALQAAIDNPKGMDCIYETRSFKVIVDGVLVTTN